MADTAAAAAAEAAAVATFLVLVDPDHGRGQLGQRRQHQVQVRAAAGSSLQMPVGRYQPRVLFGSTTYTTILRIILAVALPLSASLSQ